MQLKICALFVYLLNSESFNMFFGNMYQIVFYIQYKHNYVST